ncbi:uncharacterized protein LOC110697559 isoform X4 [Chenopodium quinoa]|uniref:uncharacterized protein LOC110697559 isoform X4 n=1 Tax=Chenopodium quinoa TaxID=63459 RepID=UPI000B77DAED|nr:uncharacterized protein LOC110697559 isoform X4 [Chenopodium quinoa]
MTGLYQVGIIRNGACPCILTFVAVFCAHACLLMIMQNRGKDFQLVNYLTEQPKFLVIIRQNLSLVVLEDQLPEMSCKLKANRAIKLLKKRAMSKEKKISAAMAAGLDWGSDDSKDEVPQQPLKEPPLPDLFKDEEHYNLISDVLWADP